MAVPISRNADGDGLVGAFLRCAQHTCRGLGAVHEHVHEVFGVSSDHAGGVRHGAAHFERFGEDGAAELCFGKISLCDYEFGIVDGGAARGVGRDVGPVDLHEVVAFGDFLRASDVFEANANGTDKRARQIADGAEASAHQLLSFGLGVADLALVSAHDGFALPERANDGSNLTHKTVEDTHLNFTHSSRSFD